jgi:DNA-directed RNA polymerase subunit F
LDLLESKPITLATVAEKLAQRKKESPSGELEYEQTNTLAYSETFAGVPADKLNSFEKELEKIATLPADAVVALADLLPRKEDEVKQILAAVKVELGDEQLKEIIKILKKYRGS